MYPHRTVRIKKSQTVLIYILIELNKIQSVLKNILIELKKYNLY